MLQNPFFQPPQIEGPQSRSWGRGLAFGFQGPPASLPTPPDVEDSDAFQQGVAAGQQAAVSGLEVVPSPCVDLNREPPAILDFTASGFEAITVGRELLHVAIGGAIFSSILLIADLSLALETHFDDPAQTLQANTDALQNLLQGMGITDSMKLFIGGAVDLATVGCELKLTPVFRSESAAFSAAKAIGRQSVLVVSWRSDQSGSIQLEEFVQ
jgi:hypothetical protein